MKVRTARVPSLATAAVLALSLSLATFHSAQAAGSDTPSPPPSSDKKSKDGKQPPKLTEDPAFLDGYRAAYTTIYERHGYADAIRQLKSLGADDRADVANLIGYSYRKLGDHRLAQVWYERALKADPTHVKTWQYYGLWQIEQGHAAKARGHLVRIQQLCGTSCPEYRSLAAALDAPAGSRRTY